MKLISRFGALFSLPTSFPNSTGQTQNSNDKLTSELSGKEAILDNMHINIHFYTLPIKNKVQTTQKIKQSFLNYRFSLKSRPSLYP